MRYRKQFHLELEVSDLSNIARADDPRFEDFRYEARMLMLTANIVTYKNPNGVEYVLKDKYHPVLGEIKTPAEKVPDGRPNGDARPN